MIDTAKIRDAIVTDCADLGVYDETSIHILAIGRVAQATLAAEAERMSAAGALPDEVRAYQEERGAQLDRWMAIEVERARTRAVAREEVDRVFGAA